MSALVAAKTLGEVSGWCLTNLGMQKVLYVAQMMHLGRTDEPLFKELFEAWEFGPVVPSVYHLNKKHGRDLIAPFDGEAFTPDFTEYHAIADAFTMTRHMTPGQLVTYTHRAGGAWERHFDKGVILNSSILKEFQEFMRPSDEAVAWACEMAAAIEADPSTYLDCEGERAFAAHLLEVRERQALH